MMIVLVVIAGIVVGLLTAIALGVKHRSEHNAELRHYEYHKRRPLP